MVVPFIRNMLMGPGNVSLDAGRVLWVFGALVFIIGSLAFQGYAVYLGQPFSMIEFGTGFGGGFATIMALGGVGISLKDRGVAKAQATTAASETASAA